jgi:hypothetical protein
MGYNLTRAVPMGIIGFVLGAAFVVLLRAAQQMTEIWSPQIGLVIGALVGAIFFLWGIGAFSGELAGHMAHEPEEDEFGNEIVVAEHHAEPTPLSILVQQVWSVAFWISILAIVLFAFASIPGGFGYVVSGDAAANANAIGYFQLTMANGDVLQVSQALALILFVVITLISLFGVAALIGLAVYLMNRGLKTAEVVGAQPLTAVTTAGLLAGPEGSESAPTGLAGRLAPLRSWGILIVSIVVLYVLFYEVAIGLILKEPQSLRVILSAVNAVVITLVIFRTKAVLLAVGRIARWVAAMLRKLPSGLGQK